MIALGNINAREVVWVVAVRATDVGVNGIVHTLAFPPRVDMQCQIILFSSFGPNFPSDMPCQKDPNGLHVVFGGCKSRQCRLLLHFNSKCVLGIEPYVVCIVSRTFALGPVFMKRCSVAK